ncbi:Ssu72-like protein [Coccomyxa subellipsoidea C-169]|uniref:RNA polymerase II subunit A C-terminal domain phosphatase SSU72 n=1 Tax=Coccomyxa subellipsoidea (strain C-169) TaxID=574566 RepID=I0Z004_COCSC|nr:Ssu72-like protein [Coccomyxa subellipsoidea C-169]EIE23973.1 Ssu72-like protein [Coccomyxa subellipsoidea C-169]|eukprot:XP_005648517.1 Ssu72-like protein [Coccomyxa subellipsoidea C-169]
MGKMKVAMVCASNQNRSMEAHALLKKHGFQVSSYGTNGHVKLPGTSQREPNVYDFGTPYADIYEDLRQKDENFYSRKGLLQMLQRNMGVKRAPERWQDNRDVFDAVVTFDERIMEQLLDDFNSRPQSTMKPLLVININVEDNHEEAARVAPQTLRLCQLLEAKEDWEDGIDDVIQQFEEETGRRPIYTVCFY